MLGEQRIWPRRHRTLSDPLIASRCPFNRRQRLQLAPFQIHQEPILKQCQQPGELLFLLLDQVMTWLILILFCPCCLCFMCDRVDSTVQMQKLSLNSSTGSCSFLVPISPPIISPASSPNILLGEVFVFLCYQTIIERMQLHCGVIGFLGGQTAS